MRSWVRIKCQRVRKTIFRGYVGARAPCAPTCAAPAYKYNHVLHIYYIFLRDFFLCVNRRAEVWRSVKSAYVRSSHVFRYKDITDNLTELNCILSLKRHLLLTLSVYRRSYVTVNLLRAYLSLLSSIYCCMFIFEHPHTLVN